MEAGGGGNHRSRSSTTPRRRCTCSPPPRTVVFDNHPESQAAQCLAQHMRRETRRNRSCLGKCRQFGAFLCPLEKRNRIGAKRLHLLCPSCFHWRLSSADVSCLGVAHLVQVWIVGSSRPGMIGSLYRPLPTPVQLWSGVSVAFGGRARECHTGNELRISPM